jgi:hypothetical protein
MYMYIYIYILFFVVAHELTSGAGLILCLGCLTSRAESACYLNETTRARSSRAELHRYHLYLEPF